MNDFEKHIEKLEEKRDELKVHLRHEQAARKEDQTTISDLELTLVLLIEMVEADLEWKYSMLPPWRREKTNEG